MKTCIYTILFIAAIFLNSGCKKFLEVNEDPNNPTDVAEALILAPVQTQIATNVAGGSFTFQNINGIAVITSYWTQQLALNQLQPQVDGYNIPQDELDPPWLTMYSGILQNLKIIDSKAQLNGNHSYGVIAKVLTAYTLGVATDMWGDVPYSDAFDGNFKPKYDKQEDIYKTLQGLLDAAILENQQPGGIAPGNDDYIYGGNMANWEKFAYTLKARYYMHLTNAPGNLPQVQSALALTALEKGFTSTADEANFAAYADEPGRENPWYVNTAPDQGGVVLASTLIDTLVNRNDPRLPVMATQVNGAYLGRVISSSPNADPDVYSVINTFYAGIAAPLSIVNYSEVLFLKAEATFRISGAAAATPIYQEAVKSHMLKLGLNVSSPAVLAYFASRGNLTETNALQRIIEEKFIANFLSIENYNDWRRTGFPTLNVVQDPFIPTIPLRLPYPLAEIISNNQPVNGAKISDPVWWDF